MPNGQVVVLAADTGQAYRLDVNAQTWTAIGSPSSIRNGSADMYAPGKILYTGGADISNVSNPAQKGAQVLDMTAASPSWQSVSPMAYPRYEHTMVDLPDGTVFAMGGAAVASQTTANDTLPTEIWDPGTSTFTTMASQAEGRIYHSTSVLMPDGRCSSPAVAATTVPLITCRRSISHLPTSSRGRGRPSPGRRQAEPTGRPSRCKHPMRQASRRYR